MDRNHREIPRALFLALCASSRGVKMLLWSKTFPAARGGGSLVCAWRDNVNVSSIILLSVPAGAAPEYSRKSQRIYLSRFSPLPSERSPRQSFSVHVPGSRFDHGDSNFARRITRRCRRSRSSLWEAWLTRVAINRERQAKKRAACRR